MALDYFPWDEVGDGSQMEVVDTAHERVGGKIQLNLKISWRAMPPSQWLALREFWRSCGGGVDNPDAFGGGYVATRVKAFYFEFPVTLYGSPGYGGYGGLEPADGFDADAAAGYGSGPVFTMFFLGRTLKQSYLTGYNRWQVTVNLREVA